MSNAFDSSNYPTTEPLKHIIGDRWAWKRTDLGTYGTGFTLTYEARLDSDGTTTFTFNGSWDGSAYVVEVASASTATYTKGTYSTSIYITRDSDSERVLIGQQTWTLDPNPATDAGDTRSHAKTVLDAIEAVIEGRATSSQSEYQIKDRALKYMGVDELIKFRSFYKAEYQRELDAERIAQGLGSNRKILTRFGRI